MRGDAAVRFCGVCKQNVYNLSAMTEAQAEELLARSEHTCIRYAYRADGTIVTSACAPGSRRAAPVLAAGVAGALAYTGAFAGISAAVDPPATQATAEAAPVQVAMGMKLTIGPRHRRERESPAVLDAGRNLAPSYEEPTPTELTLTDTPEPTPARPWWVALGALFVAIGTLRLTHRGPFAERP